MSLKNFSIFCRPLEGVVTGRIPPWLSGSLLMNGPGKFYYGDQVVGHLFDGSALIQKYSIEKGGAVSYTCRCYRPFCFRPAGSLA